MPKYDYDSTAQFTIKEIRDYLDMVQKDLNMKDDDCICIEVEADFRDEWGNQDVTENLSWLHIHAEHSLSGGLEWDARYKKPSEEQFGLIEEDPYTFEKSILACTSLDELNTENGKHKFIEYCYENFFDFDYGENCEVATYIPNDELKKYGLPEQSELDLDGLDDIQMTIIKELAKTAFIKEVMADKPIEFEIETFGDGVIAHFGKFREVKDEIIESE